ncbi:MAG: VPLPA-CTERM sorting domain-containing protein [Pseudomonadales bacterium]
MKPQFTKVIEQIDPAKFYVQALFASVLVMLAFGAKADLVFPSGICGHDTNGFETCAVDVASLNGNVTYTWNGSVGHLQFSGTPGNARFRPDQNVGNWSSPSDPFGAGLNVISAGGTTETFTFDFYLDAAGEFVSGGTVDVDGYVLGGFSGGMQNATLNGVSLNGTLIEGNIFDAGGAVQGSAAVFDFRYFINTSTSKLSDAFPSLDDSIGQMSVTNITGCDIGAGCDPFTTSWTGSGATANVFVPIPAALWLFGSALLGLGVVRRGR